MEGLPLNRYETGEAMADDLSIHEARYQLEVAEEIFGNSSALDDGPLENLEQARRDLEVAEHRAQNDDY